MSNLEELKKKYEELGKEIERLEKEKRWRAKDLENYYYIDEEGCVNSIFEDNSDCDVFKYKTRNYFKTEKEAQRHLDNINTYYELMNLAEELNKGEKIDWENMEQNKYSVSFDVELKLLHQRNTHFYKRIGEIYCLDANFLEIALERIGEDRLENLFKEERDENS